jgi:hypothetical protein
VDVDVHAAQPVARLARSLAVLEKGDDATLLHAEIMHGHAAQRGELPSQQCPEHFDLCLDRVDANPRRIAGGDAEADVAGDRSLPAFEPARVIADDVSVGIGPGG